MRPFHLIKGGRVQLGPRAVDDSDTSAQHNVPIFVGHTSLSDWRENQTRESLRDGQLLYVTQTTQFSSRTLLGVTLSKILIYSSICTW